MGSTLGAELGEVEGKRVGCFVVGEREGTVLGSVEGLLLG